MAASPSFPKLPSDWTESSHYNSEQSLHLRLMLKKNVKLSKVLIVVHGQGEQSDRYQHFPHYLSSQVQAIFAVDMPGHGLSKGTRGHIESFADYHNACKWAYEFCQNWLKQNQPETAAQIHWFGHSLGGLISLGYAIDNPTLDIKSFTISAPLLELAFKAPAVKKAFAKLTEPILGRVPLGNELDVNTISKDTEVIQEYGKNSLNHGYVTPRFFVRLLKEMERVRSFAGPFNYPLTAIIPLADVVVSHQVAYHFFKDLKMQDGKTKNLVTLGGFFHESFNDPGKERAFTALDQFLSSFAQSK